MAISEWTLQKEIAEISGEVKALDDAYNSLKEYVRSDDFIQDLVNDARVVLDKINEFQGKVSVFIERVEEILSRIYPPQQNQPPTAQIQITQASPSVSPPQQPEKRFGVEKALVIASAIFACVIGAKEGFVPIEISTLIIFISLILPFLGQIKELITSLIHKKGEAPSGENDVPSLLKNINERFMAIRNEVIRVHLLCNVQTQSKENLPSPILSMESEILWSRRKLSALKLSSKIMDLAGEIVVLCKSYAWHKRFLVNTAMAQLAIPVRS
ncbi:MAG: hypothetical protein QXU81_00115 [Candidatus Bathyarchaeia archaeon]